ncbi:AlpA family phage regulatory protein [Legionella sp. km535]|uniref:helix-turn-helix transcriptional regulator n=1 Tax=Legionella sp. km535 TaxID=2498107 RepID=UPI000F8DA4D3|nr:AlpA family phage regulatory protein [Legionella sp. km535]RUR15181.1 AlpA family phage regulatory protein [Legionella sp. km535]
MYELPQTGFLRIDQILGSPKHSLSPLIPVGKSTWWEGVKTGRFPKPIKLGPKITVWRVEDIKQLIEQDFPEYKPRRGRLCKKKDLK